MVTIAQLLIICEVGLKATMFLFNDYLWRGAKREGAPAPLNPPQKQIKLLSLN